MRVTVRSVRTLSRKTVTQCGAGSLDLVISCDILWLYLYCMSFRGTYWGCSWTINPVCLQLQWQDALLRSDPWKIWGDCFEAKLFIALLSEYTSRQSRPCEFLRFARILHIWLFSRLLGAPSMAGFGHAMVGPFQEGWCIFKWKP